MNTKNKPMRSNREKKGLTGKKKKTKCMIKKKRKRQKPNEKRKRTLEEDIFVQNRGWFLFSPFSLIWRDYILVGTGRTFEAYQNFSYFPPFTKQLSYHLSIFSHLFHPLNFHSNQTHS